MNIVWKIEWMNCIPQNNAIQNYVIECGWRCNALEGEYSATNYGSCGFAPSPVSASIPYDQLTEADVLGWVWESVDKDDVEAGLSKQINLLINPKVVQPPLPW